MRKTPLLILALLALVPPASARPLWAFGSFQIGVPTVVVRRQIACHDQSLFLNLRSAGFRASREAQASKVPGLMPETRSYDILMQVPDLIAVGQCVMLYPGDTVVVVEKGDDKLNLVQIRHGDALFWADAGPR